MFSYSTFVRLLLRRYCASVGFCGATFEETALPLLDEWPESLQKWPEHSDQSGDSYDRNRNKLPHVSATACKIDIFIYARAKN